MVAMEPYAIDLEILAAGRNRWSAASIRARLRSVTRAIVA